MAGASTWLAEVDSGGGLKMDDSVDTDGGDVRFLLILLDCITLIVNSEYSHNLSDDMQWEHIGRFSSHYGSL